MSNNSTILVVLLVVGSSLALLSPILFSVVCLAIEVQKQEEISTEIERGEEEHGHWASTSSLVHHVRLGYGECNVQEELNHLAHSQVSLPPHGDVQQLACIVVVHEAVDQRVQHERFVENNWVLLIAINIICILQYIMHIEWRTVASWIQQIHSVMKWW